MLAYLSGLILFYLTHELWEHIYTALLLTSWKIFSGLAYFTLGFLHLRGAGVALLRNLLHRVVLLRSLYIVLLSVKQAPQVYSLRT